MKGVNPRAHCALDLALFVLLLIVGASALVDHVAPDSAERLHAIASHVHGIAGVALFLTVGLHLFLHWRWIEVQVRRMLGT